MTESENGYNENAIEFNPFEGSEILSSIESTESQLEIWITCKIGGDDANRAFNLSYALKLEGNLDAVLFEKAVAELVNRHQSLRSAFTMDGSQMMIFKEMASNYVFLDLSHLQRSEIEDKIANVNKSEVLYTFDLLNGPLSKFVLLKLSSTEFYLTMTVHHIICDGWSVGVLIRELSNIYSAFVRKTEPSLGEAASFSAYAINEAEYINSSEHARSESYWLNQFHNDVPVMNLPVDFSRPVPRTYKSTRLDSILDSGLVSSLREIGMREGCSFVNTILTSFELYLRLYTGQKDIVIGLPTAGQLISGNYGLVGHCVNLLPVRSAPDTGLSFIEYLASRKSSLLDVLEHQRLTFGDLLKKLKIARDPSRIPLIPVLFNINTEIGKDVYFHGLNHKIISLPKEYENFELFLNISDEGNTLQLEWTYNTQIFKSDTIQTMMSDFEEFLKTIVFNPSQKIDSFVLEGILKNNKDRLGHEYLITGESTFEIDRNFWLRQFEGELPILNFPTDRMRPAVRSYKYSSVDRKFDKILVDKFMNLLQSRNSSVYSGFVSLINILLFRYTNQRDIILGSMVRENVSNGGQIQKHTVAVRSNIDERSGFLSILNQVGQSINHLKKHLSYSLESLLEELCLIEDVDNVTLYNVMMVLEESQIESNKYQEKPYLIFIFNNSDDLRLSVQFDDELFDEISITRLIGHIEGLIRSVTEDPLKAINSLEYISKSEKNQLLHEFNDSVEDYPDNLSIIDLFEKQSFETPENIALVFEDEQLTYQKLNEMANQVAHFLVLKGIKDGDIVPIFIERSTMMMIGILGVLKTGASFVPIDPEYPSDRINFMLNDVGAKLIISSEKSYLKLKNRVIEVVTLDNDWIEISKQSTVNLENIVTARHLAYIIHTSGSTGQPKGVMIEHRGVVNLIISAGKKVEFNSGSGMLSVTTFSFDISYLEFFLPLINGGKLILVSRETAMDGFELSRAIRKYRVTHLQGTPSTWQILLDVGWNNSENIKMLIGGEAVKEDIKNSLAKIGEIYNFYGPTETTIWSVSKKLSLNEKVLIGKPLANTSIFILDGDMQLVPVGITGEICIGGPGLARGYLNRPDLTNLKFIDNPIDGFSGTKIYKTGDNGKWLADGNIECLGRIDDQVKIRGYRIELGEIENIIQEYPSIDGAIVTVSEEAGTGKILIAYLKSQNEIELTKLVEYMRLKLPPFMIPSNFLIMKDFPLTSNGKLDKRKLPKLNEKQSNEGGIVYNSKLEKLIASIWSDLLNIKNIKLTDNFFEIGGHSLIAIKFIVQIENEINIKIPLSSLFEYPTIEELAKFMQSKDKVQRWKSLVNIKTSGDKLPVYLIHGLGLGVLIFNNIATYLDKNQPVYGIQALGIDGNEEPLETIEEMAAFYVSEMLEQNPEGPYNIAGLSAGGLIAFEMAQILKRLGKKVNKLIILDFNLINAQARKSGPKRLLESIINSPFIILYNIRSIFINPIKTIKYYGYYWNLRFTTFYHRFKERKKDKLEGFHKYHQQAIRKHELALPKYEIKPYDGVIDLFVSQDKPYYEKDLKFMGWKPYALKGINSYKVDGDHDDMILPPNNKKFASILQKVLDGE